MSFDRTFIVMYDDMLSDPEKNWVVKHDLFSHEAKRRDPDKIKVVPMLSGGSLLKVALADKLIITGHSGPEAMLESYPLGVDSWKEHDEEAVAIKLAKAGLKEAGMITFHNCRIGKAEFLETLLYLLTVDHKVKVGWLKGYKGGLMIGNKGKSKIIKDGGVVLSMSKNREDYAKIVRGNTWVPYRNFTTDHGHYQAYQEMMAG